MERYRNYGSRDDVPVNDGDTFFNGFSSRLQPSSLPAGILAYSQNGRMDHGTWRMRKGAKSLSQSITVPTNDLLVDSTSITDGVFVYSFSIVDGYAYIRTFTPHNLSTLDVVDIGGFTKAVYNGTAVVTVIDEYNFKYAFNNTWGSTSYSLTGSELVTASPVLTDGSYPALASCAYSSRGNRTEGIMIAGLNSAYLYTYTGGMQAVNYPFNETCDIDQNTDIIQYNNNVFIFRGYGDTDWLAASVDVSGLDIPGAGLYNITSFTTTVPHGLTVGDYITSYDASTAKLNGIFLVQRVLSELSVDVSCPYVTAGIYTASIRKSKPALYWDMDLSAPYFIPVTIAGSPLGSNYRRMPSVDWGVPFKSSMIIPYSSDELLISDVLDPDTYETGYNQFRTLPGSADWLVAVAPFQEDKFLVLYRKSTHIIQLGDTLEISKNTELTRAFGCVARRTAINCGQYLLWLSDLGIIRMNVTDFLVLKNDTKPLSDDIQDIIDSINWKYADNATGKYWNNRAFFAIPTGSSTVNNTIIVFNFLNDKWESKDAYPTDFNVIGLHSIDYDGKQRLFAVTTTGFVFLLDEVEANDERITGTPSSVTNEPIDAYLETREYLAGSYDVKTIKRVQVEASGDIGGTVTTQASLRNPDMQTAQNSFVRTVGNHDVSIRNTINRRGSAIQMKVSTTVASSDIKAIGIEGRVSAHSTIDRE